MKPPMLSLAARESVGAGSPGRYFPVSTPCASGDQTICEICSRSHSGISCASGARHSIEYCGWLEAQRATPGSSPAIASDSSTRSTGHSLKPMWRALPAATTSPRAPIVSASGVSSS
jgi:hypothetical protein